jgi:protoporphyrinogen oxidase
LETIDTLIIGAGPAGLTTAYNLAKAGHDVLVIEQDKHYVGGISRTVSYKGFLFDIGFADLIAIPRPFAEALVFAGLAAVAARRDVVAILFIVAAALLHPIMRWPDWESWLPSAVWKTSAGFGFALSVVLC